MNWHNPNAAPGPEAWHPPFLVGAELHNSSSSTPQVLRARIARVAALGVDVVLAAISWELVEPREGRFNLALVDSLVAEAREQHVKLIPLWFGSWKNGVSSYVPGWVQSDQDRFPLVEDATGRRLQTLSPFSEALRDADAHAFARVMRRIRELDPSYETVVAVQVENEVGVLGASRDHSSLARTTYDSPVPADLLATVIAEKHSLHPVFGTLGETSVKENTTWGAVFGTTPQADEIFMAHGYARFIAAVAASGTAEHDVPLFVNAWLDSDDAPEAITFAGGNSPGIYPSGGPLPQVAAVWRQAAPALALAPDIYYGDFGAWCRLYQRVNSGGPIIPEMPSTVRSVGDIHLAIGQFSARLVALFGLDGLTPETDGEIVDVVTGAFLALRNVRARLQAAQSRGRSIGFHFVHGDPVELELGDWIVHVRKDGQDGPGDPDHGWGVLFEEADGSFVTTGSGFSLQMVAPDGAHLVRCAQTGHFEDGSWQTTQHLNGDETNSGAFVRMPHRDPAIAHSEHGGTPLKIQRFSLGEWTV